MITTRGGNGESVNVTGNVVEGGTNGSLNPIAHDYTDEQIADELMYVPASKMPTNNSFQF